MKLNWPQDLDESRFLAEYWQQKPLLLRNAFENFDNPLDPNELAGLACEEDSNARYIEHTGNNEWRLCAGPLSEDFFDDVSGNEWSLLVSDVEKLLPEFQQYLQGSGKLKPHHVKDLNLQSARPLLCSVILKPMKRGSCNVAIFYICHHNTPIMASQKTSPV